MSQVLPNVLQDIRVFLADQGIRSTIRWHKPRGFNAGKGIHDLDIQCRGNVIKFLERISPYLRTKKKVYAQDVIRYHKIYPAMRGVGSRGWQIKKYF